MPAPTHFTQSIILKKIPLGEADVLVMAFTKDFGKIKLLAKGAKKIGAKLAPYLDVLNKSEIGFVEGKQFLRLTDCDTVEYYPKTKSNLGRLAAAFFAAGLIDNLIVEDAVAKKEFEEAEKILAKINSAADNKIQYLPYIFAARFLSLLGYHPKLEKSTNEMKLLRICLEYGYDVIDKIDLSAVEISKLRFAVEAMLKKVVHRGINAWKFLEKCDSM